MVRVIEKPAVEAMLTLAGCIPFKHYGLHVVIQHSARDTAEVFERVIMEAPDQRLDFHVGDEFDKIHPVQMQRILGSGNVPSALIRRIAPTHIEGLNLRGIFRFPIEEYDEQLLPTAIRKTVKQVY